MYQPEFIWNSTEAERIRYESARAMQGSATDMREASINLLKEAEQRQQEIAQIDATLPIMRTETRTGHRQLNCGDYESYTYEISVVNQVATNQAIARMRELTRQMTELRQAANLLENTADRLEGKIAATNKLFYELQDRIMRTDEHYARKMEFVKEDIERYIAKIAALRDSVGEMFIEHLGIDYDWYFGGSYQLAIKTIPCYNI